MLVEMWKAKPILMKSQMEMRNMLFGQRGKDNPCYKVGKNLAELYSSSNFYRICE